MVVGAGGGGRKEREAYLLGVDKTELDTVSRVLEQAINVGERWDKIHTDFLSPPEAAAVQMVLSRLPDVTAVSYGGYPQAERKRFVVGRYRDDSNP